MRVEEEFENLMLNIDIQVVSISSKMPELSDFGVDKVFNAFLSKYKALWKGREPKEVSFGSPENELYLLIKDMCDFFTGDSETWGEGEYLIELDTEKVSYETMIAVFKRFRKSVKTWTKRGGSKGYIYYISQFLPEFSDNENGKNPVIDAFIEKGQKNINLAKKN